MWKRYSAEITHRWDLTGFDVQEEHPRPQYLARLAHVKRKCVNIITNTMEPHVPFWKIKVPMTIFSFSIVLLLVRVKLRYKPERFLNEPRFVLKNIYYFRFVWRWQLFWP